jgi:HlyD family secretion protein
VSPGTAILKLADPRTAWTTVHVDEAEIGGISVGDPADLSLRSLPGQILRGRVARIQRESDRVTEQLAIDIAFDEPPARLALGEQAEARIRPPVRKDVTAIPLSALVRLADGAGAWTVVRGRLAFRVLRLGVVDPEGWIEALEGIRPGEAVVVGPGRLADPANEGRRVTAVPARPPLR